MSTRSGRMVIAHLNNRLIAHVKSHWNRATVRLVITDDYLPWGVVHFTLRAHLLDLRGLLFELRGHGFHAFPLLAT